VKSPANQLFAGTWNSMPEFEIINFALRENISTERALKPMKAYRTTMYLRKQVGCFVTITLCSSAQHLYFSLDQQSVFEKQKLTSHFVYDIL